MRPRTFLDGCKPVQNTLTRKGETMRTTTKYVSDDGCEFDSMLACAKYETMARIVQVAMNPLGERPNLGMDEWVQQDRQSCLTAKRGLLAIIRDRWSADDFAILRHNDDAIHPSSFVGRLVCDSGIKCLQSAWNRLQTINWDTFREYSHPYYALHPEEAQASQVSV